MPDLMSHVLLGSALGVPLRKRLDPALFLFGNVLPDLGARALPIVLGPYVERIWIKATVFNLPVGLLLQIVLLGILLPPSIRRRGMLSVGAGVVFHSLLDAMQTNVTGAGRLQAFPVSTAQMTFGVWFSSDWPIIVMIALLPGLWGLRRLWRERKSPIALPED